MSSWNGRFEGGCRGEGGREKGRREKQKKKKKVRKSFTLSTLRISLMAAWAMLVVDFFPFYFCIYSFFFAIKPSFSENLFSLPIAELQTRGEITQDERQGGRKGQE